MKTIQTLCALALLIAAVHSSDVLTGTESNLAELIAGDGVKLIEFYAPWCGHCKQLAPEWEKAATALKGKAKLIAVDATENNKVAEEYQVQGFPTIFAIVDGQRIPYEGGRTADAIVKYASKAAQPPITKVSSGQLQKHLAESKVAVVVYLTQGVDIVEGIAKSVRSLNLDFLQIESAEAPVKTHGVFVIRQGSEAVQFEGEIEAKALQKFIEANSFPTLGEIGPDNYKQYIQRGLPLAWLMVDPANEEKTASAKKIVEEVARNFQGKYSFVWLSGVQYPQMAQKLGLPSKPEDFPNIGLEESEDAGGQKYVYTKEITKDAVQAWAQSIADGTAVAHVNSAEAPEKDTVDGLTTLVGSTFQRLVMDPTKDAFIEFYAPWCGHCKNLAPKWAELAKKAESATDILIAQMDATANDAPKIFKVSGYPTLYLKKAGAEPQIVDYHGAREVDDMFKWLQENAVNGAQLGGGEKDEL